MFMQFREFNIERGQWASGLDALLFFFAYWTFAFLFSFGMAIVFEIPIAACWYEFVIKKKPQQDAFYHSQSAKSVYRDKSLQEENGSGVSKKKLLDKESKKRMAAMEEDPEDLEDTGLGSSAINHSEYSKRTMGSGKHQVIDDDEDKFDHEDEDNTKDKKKKLYIYKPK